MYSKRDAVVCKPQNVTAYTLHLIFFLYPNCFNSTERHITLHTAHSGLANRKVWMFSLVLDSELEFLLNNNNNKKRQQTNKQKKAKLYGCMLRPRSAVCFTEQAKEDYDHG